MRKIKLLTSVASNQYSASYGEIIELPIAEADRMVSSGQAEYIDPGIRNAMAIPETEKKVINKSGKK